MIWIDLTTEDAFLRFPEALLDKEKLCSCNLTAGPQTNVTCDSRRGVPLLPVPAGLVRFSDPNPDDHSADRVVASQCGVGDGGEASGGCLVAEIDASSSEKTPSVDEAT